MGVEAGQREVREDDLIGRGGKQLLEATAPGRQIQLDGKCRLDQRFTDELCVQGRVIETEDAQRSSTVPCSHAVRRHPAPFRGRSLTSAQNMPSCWTAAMKLANSTGLTT